MSRFARIAVPGLPHHVTQWGNRREPIFFEGGGQEIYCDLPAEQTARADVDVWAYCPMPNHVHLILVPNDATDRGARQEKVHRDRAAKRSAIGGISMASPVCNTQIVLSETWLLQ